MVLWGSIKFDLIKKDQSTMTLHYDLYIMIYTFILKYLTVIMYITFFNKDDILSRNANLPCGCQFNGVEIELSQYAFNQIQFTNVCLMIVSHKIKEQK